jgi:hypothetical protein
MPFSQNFEQHCALAVHALPSVLHVLLSGAHVPLVHVPLQHCPLLVHDWLSLTHVGGWHAPFRQLPEQQSLLCLHDVPRFRHVGGPPSEQLFQHPASPPPESLLTVLSLPLPSFEPGESTPPPSFTVPSVSPSLCPVSSPPHAEAPATNAPARKTISATRRRFIFAIIRVRTDARKMVSPPTT